MRVTVVEVPPIVLRRPVIPAREQRETSMKQHVTMISLGVRDVIDNADGTLFITLGITDLPGIIYWLSR